MPAGEASEMIFIEAGLLFVSTLSIIVAGVWRLGLVRDELKEHAEKQRLDIEADINTLRDQVGETMTAFREKLTQVELYIRDNYVRKDSFNLVMDRMSAELRVVAEKFENRCTKMETNIMNYLHDRNSSPP